MGTYEPNGDVFQNGKKISGSDFVGLEEMATISVMCNDSAIDHGEYKNAFEKVGEATETALIVLAEKVNPYGVSKSGGRLDSAKAVRKDMEGKWKKEEVVRDDSGKWPLFQKSDFDVLTLLQTITLQHVGHFLSPT